MALFVLHPWAQFLAGMLTGCWIGVVIGCGVTLLLVGKRIRQMETANLLLRSRLKSRGKQQKTGTGGPPLFMPHPSPERSAGKPFGRAAGRL